MAMVGYVYDVYVFLLSLLSCLVYGVLGSYSPQENHKMARWPVTWVLTICPAGTQWVAFAHSWSSPLRQVVVVHKFLKKHHKLTSTRSLKTRCCTRTDQKRRNPGKNVHKMYKKIKQDRAQCKHEWSPQVQRPLCPVQRPWSFNAPDNENSATHGTSR